MGVDFGKQPGYVPPIIEKRPCIYHFLPPFPPAFWLAHPTPFMTSLRLYANELHCVRFYGNLRWHVTFENIKNAVENIDSFLSTFNPVFPENNDSTPGHPQFKFLFEIVFASS